MTGLLRGKPLRVLRQIEDRNGYELWWQLTQLYAPKTKARSISVLSALLHVPSFTKDKTLLDQVLGLERLRAEYAKSSGADLPDDLMLSVLVRALPRHIQQHVQLQMDENSTYEDVRALVVGYEKVTTSWSPGKIHAELGILGQPGSQQQQPVPMEIGKGSQKGKDGSKGKSKNAKGGKGSSTGKDGKGKGNSTPVCFHRQKPGHTKRDCWLLHGKPKNVNVVADDGTSVAGSAVGSSSSASNSQTGVPTANPGSNAVRLFSSTGVIIEELSDSDGEVIDLTAYDSFSGACMMVSQIDEFHDSSAGLAYMSCCPQFDMTYSDCDDSWTVVDECESLSSPTHMLSDVDVEHVRAIHSSGSGALTEIVLDSGADGSVLPASFLSVGTSVDGAKSSQYVDAQGNPITIHDAKIAKVKFGPITFREKFVVADVTTPLISMGRLLKDGWNVSNDQDQLNLVKGKRSIPLHFRRNSLCAFGEIRMLSEDSPSDQDPVHVRAVQLGPSLTNLGRGWNRLDENVLALHSQSLQHVDTTYAPADSLLWHRTTLVKLSDGSWHVEEFCQKISELPSRTTPLSITKNVTDVITLAHTFVVPPEVLGFSVVDDAPQQDPASSSSSVRDRGFLDLVPPVVPAQVDAADPPADVPAADGDAELPEAERDDAGDPKEVYVNGVKLDSNTTLKVLRDACESLGLAKRGGKMKCLERLWKHLEQHELIASQAAERELRGSQERIPVASMPPKVPTEDEVSRHQLTHQPYQSWCEVCVAHRGRQDAHSAHGNGDRQSDRSLVSFDFGYASRLPTDDKLCFLAIHDSWTGAMHCVPTPMKGGKYLSHLCTEFCRFISWLGHDKIALRCDQEPSTLSLLEAVRKTCRTVGIGVSVENVVPADHAANGAAETTVNVLRQNAGVFITQIEKAIGIDMTIGSMHPLYSWGLIHSAWIHNRFTVRQGQTPYELCSSRMYSGKVALFGEAVLGFLRTTQKAAPSWTKGLWLGKALNNDAHIVGVPPGRVFVTRSIRRLPNPWDMQLIADFEASSWDFGLAALGPQLVMAKRITGPQPNTPNPLALHANDPEARAVMGIPGTPEQDQASLVLPPRSRPIQNVPPPEAAVVASEAGDLDAAMAGPMEIPLIPREVQSSVPTTPIVMGSGSSGSGVAAEVPMPVSSPISHAVHEHDAVDSDRPTKIPRILAVQGLDHEDDDLVVYLDNDELDELEAYDETLSEHDELYDDTPQDLCNESAMELLCRPYTSNEPDLGAEELAELDALADKVELQRLQAMGVLIPVSSLSQQDGFDGFSDFKKLSTRMVRTWRDKRLGGKRVWLRRSRYVAREYAWLTPDRQDLFSPASSALTTRLLPTLFLRMMANDFVLCAIDIGDAYLTVPQKIPTLVSYDDKSGNHVEFSLGRVLPGQRDGALLWHESITAFLLEEMSIGCCEAYPSLLRSKCGSCMMLLHVDDILCLCTRDFLDKTLEPTLNQVSTKFPWR